MNSQSLSISIICECNPCHDWMAFASWYSIRKRVPDCIVSLETCLTKPLCGWTNRFGVKISRRTDSVVKFPVTTMAVREFGDNYEISSSKSSKQTAFVDYAEGCGNFVMSEWIHTEKVPFYRAFRRFGSFCELTINETAVLNIWEQCHNLYQQVGGS